MKKVPFHKKICVGCVVAITIFLGLYFVVFTHFQSVFSGEGEFGYMSCNDAADNDSDSYTDCDDPDCLGNAACGGTEEGSCSDSSDNDEDGMTDCSDGDCSSDPSCAPSEDCDNYMDDDGDGYTDCDDSDCSSDPWCASSEDCDNYMDDDGDGDTDCYDSDCTSDPACAPAVEDCDNGTDDDGDTDIDCYDTDCSLDPACLPPEDCDNLADDDGDGDTDCTDSDCSSFDLGASYGSETNCSHVYCQDGALHNANCATGGECEDLLDNDGNGQEDCADSTCSSNPACDIPEICDNGMDDDGDGDTDCDDSECVSYPACLAEICDNGTDDDGDGYIDCDDAECSAFDTGNVYSNETDCLQYYCAGGDLITVNCSTGSECTDGVDNDGNNNTDCEDASCETYISESYSDEITCVSEYCSAGTMQTGECSTGNECSDNADNDGNSSADCVDSACSEVNYCTPPVTSSLTLMGGEADATITIVFDDNLDESNVPDAWDFSYSEGDVLSVDIAGNEVRLTVSPVCSTETLYVSYAIDGTSLMNTGGVNAEEFTNTAIDNLSSKDCAAPVAPGTPDLIDASDNGASNSDNITNINSLTFLVSPCEDDATVELYVDGVEEASEICVSGSVNITTLLGENSYDITAKQVDGGSNVSVSSDPLNVIVDNTVPSIPTSITLDTSSDTGASNSDRITSDTTPTFTIGCTDGLGVYTYQAGSALINSATTTCSGGISSFTSAALTSGNVGFYTQHIDVAGNKSLSTGRNVAITIDTASPSVSLSAPANGATLSGSNTLTASASDPNGIRGVLFKIDNTSIGSEDTSSPFTVSLDSTLYVSGAYTLSAVATDNAGNVATSSISVTISNTVIPGPTGSSNSYNRINVVNQPNIQSIGSLNQDIQNINIIQPTPAPNTDVVETLKTPEVKRIPDSFAFLKNIKLGTVLSDDTRMLQRFLNDNGFTVAQVGAGSVGNETRYFGPATRVALARFQRAVGISPSIGYFGPITRAYINSLIKSVVGN